MAQSAFGSVVNEIISNSFAMSLTSERQGQIERIGKYWDFYYGDQEQYIKRYEGESSSEYDDKDKPTFNYTKAIINEYINGVTGKPIQFEFGDKAQQKIWEAITQPLQFFEIMPFFIKVQRIAEISDTCVTMIRYNKREKRTFFEDIRGEFVSYLPKEENPKEIGTLIISYNFDTGHPDPSQRTLKRVEIWDDEKWEVWLQSPFTGDEKRTASGPNPFGFIPAERFMPEEDDNTFYGVTGIGDVVKINEIYNNLWTALARIVVFQSFSVLYVKSENEIELQIAPTRLLTLPESVDGDASYLTPSPKINEVKAVLNDIKKELEDVAHVPQEVLSSSKALTPESGYALRIKRIPIEEEWAKRRLSYGPAFKSLAKKTVWVDLIQNGDATKENLPDVEVNVGFTDTVPPLSPQEQILTDEQNMRYGLITPVDLMIRRNPTLTRDEAKAQIEKNLKETEGLGLSQFGTDNETEFEKMAVKMGRKEAEIEKPAEVE